MASSSTHKRVNKFMDGQMSPREAHAHFGIRKQCAKCQLPATNRIRVLVELKELERRKPEFTAMIKATNPNGPIVPTIDTKYGPMVMLHDLGCCDGCRKAMEVQAAHGAEDWMLVEIDRGPDDVKTQVVVPGHD